jgi:hypothetical protein
MTSFPPRHRTLALRVRGLAALAAAGLAACAPPTVEKSLAELPGLELELVDTDAVRVVLHTQREGKDCYRLRGPVQATLNGAPLRFDTPGGGGLNFEGYAECYLPTFVVRGWDGTDWPPRQRSEVVISDGTTTVRAVFLNIDVERTVRVNGQEAPVLHAGDDVSLEWFPETDHWRGPARVLANTTPDIAMNWRTATTSDTDGVTVSEDNRLHFTLATLPPGDYTLLVTGEVEVGVEACEGAVRCTATVWPELEAFVPVVVR